MNKREIIKIQQGNETSLSIRALLPDGITKVPVVQIGDGFRPEHVYFTINGHETADGVSFEVKERLLVVAIPSTLPIAKYGIHVTGHMIELDKDALKEHFKEQHMVFDPTKPLQEATTPELLNQFVVVGNDVDCNFVNVFEIVPHSDNVCYDNYVTDIFMVGLPDAVLERLKEEYAQKVNDLNTLIARILASLGGGVSMMTEDEYEPALKALEEKLV